MFAFGVSTQALMYENQTLNSDLLKNVFFPAYFIIGGEYYTREVIMSGNFCYNSTNLIKFLFNFFSIFKLHPTAVIRRLWTMTGDARIQLGRVLHWLFMSYISFSWISCSLICLLPFSSKSRKNLKFED